jgi:hypothetical protein
VIRRGVVAEVPQRATLSEELAFNNPEAAFLIRHGREITVHPRPDGDPATLRVRLLGRVMAFLFRQRGWLPLHASGVLVNNECVLFLGAARAGKSTTAAAFHGLGHQVVTDDVAPVRVDTEGRCVLQSAWSFVRLRSDAQQVLNNKGDSSTAFQAGKHRYDLDTGRAGGARYPVRCAYIIEFSDRISVEPVRTVGAIPLLSQHSFVRHRQMGRESLESHVRDCAAVARAIPVRRLTRSRSLAALPALVHFVEDDLAALAVPGYR